MEVVGDHLGVDPHELLELLDALLEVPTALEGLEVAHVGTDPRLVTGGEAHRVLQMGAARQDRARQSSAQAHRPRDVAARAAEHRRPARHHGRHRVVAAVLDGPIVLEEEVGEAAESLVRLVVAVDHGLVGDVPRGHHEGAPDLAEQQHVERRVHQHQPDGRQAGRDPVREPRVRPAREQDDRPLDRLEEPGLFARDDGQALGGVQIVDHHGQRLRIPALPLAERLDCLRRRRVAGQVKSAEPLHRDDGAGADRGGRAGARVAWHDGTRGGGQPEARAALRAGDGLGMEAPIARIAVLGPACRAHRERRHGGARAVVGEVAADRVARATAGAGHEGVTIAAVGGIQQLSSAVRAQGQIGRNARRPPPAGRRALDDLERGDRLVGDRRHPDVGHRRRRIGGAATRRAKRSSASAVPNASTTTHDPTLKTRPRRRAALASEYTHGRKPTPWTRPPSSIRTPAAIWLSLGSLHTPMAAAAVRRPSQAYQAGRPAGGRDAEDRRGGIDSMQADLEPRDIERHVRQEIALVQDDEMRRLEHVGILRRLVVALRHAGHHDPGRLAQVEQGRAHEVADVLDHQHRPGRGVEPPAGVGDHPGVEMAHRPGVDLDDRRAASGDPAGVVVRLLIAVDDRPGPRAAKVPERAF